MATMKALVKSKAEIGLWLEDVPVPAIGINDVLIEILRTGICGTDLHIYDWDAWAQKLFLSPWWLGMSLWGGLWNLGPMFMISAWAILLAGKVMWFAEGAAIALPGGVTFARTPRGWVLTDPGLLPNIFPCP